MFLILATLAIDPSLTRLRNEDARVASMSWRIQMANAALCPAKGPITGLSIHALSQYRADQRPAAASQFSLGSHPGIAAVASGSAADRAGLKPGDALLAIGEQATPLVDAGAGYTPVGQTEALLDGAVPHSPVVVRIERNGKAEATTLTPDIGCVSRVQIVAGQNFNAKADGTYVQINAAMLDFATSDDDLAVVVAHEMAHNILRHRARNTPSKAAEYAADHLGVWLMVRAGYSVEAIVPFWTRFEKQTNAGIFSDGSHPSSKKRIAAVAAAVALLKAQRESGQPLIPLLALMAQ